MITTTNLVIIAVTVLVSLMCFKDRTLFYKLSLNPYDIVHRKQWYRIVTHGFVHGDTMHLLINMLVLWSFGTNIELRLQYLALSDDAHGENAWNIGSTGARATRSV